MAGCVFWCFGAMQCYHSLCALICSDWRQITFVLCLTRWNATGLTWSSENNKFGSDLLLRRMLFVAQIFATRETPHPRHLPHKSNVIPIQVPPLTHVPFRNTPIVPIPLDSFYSFCLRICRIPNMKWHSSAQKLTETSVHVAENNGRSKIREENDFPSDNRKTLNWIRAKCSIMWFKQGTSRRAHTMSSATLYIIVFVDVQMVCASHTEVRRNAVEWVSCWWLNVWRWEKYFGFDWCDELV